MPRHGKKRDDSRQLRIEVTRAIVALRSAEYKVMHLENRIGAKISQLNQRLVQAKRQGRDDEATLLAAEIAERMKLLDQIRGFRLGLERLRTRLETVKLVGEARPLLQGIEPMISEIRSNIATSIPEVGIIYAQLEERLAELGAGLEAPLAPASNPPSQWAATDDEVRRILREAEEVARAREAQDMPEPPSGGKS